MLNILKNKLLSEKQIIQKEPNFREGLKLLKEKQYSKALILFKRSAAKMPNQPKILNNIGVAMAGMKNYAQAIEHYKKAIELDPNYYIAYFNLAIAYDNLSKIDEALDVVNKVLKSNKDLDGLYIKAVLLKSMLLEKKSDIDSAIEVLEDACAKIKDNNIIKKLIKLYYLKEDFIKLYELLDKEIKGQDIESEEMLKIILETLIKLKKEAEFPIYFNNFAQREGAIDEVKSLAGDYIKSGNLKASILLYEAMFNNDPENYLTIGQILISLYEKIGNIDRALEIAYEIFDIFFKKGIIEKLESLLKFIEKYKREDVNPRLKLIELYKKNNLLEKAEKSYEIIIEKKLEDIELVKDYVNLLEKLAEKDRKYLEKIVQIWDKFSAVFPDNPEVMLELGKIYANNFKYQEAIQFLEQAIAIKPDLYEAYFHLGLLYFSLGKFNRALNYLSKIKHLRKEFPEVDEIIKEIKKMDQK